MPQGLHLLPLLLIIVRSVIREKHKSGETFRIRIMISGTEDANEKLNYQDVIIVMRGVQGILQLLQYTALSSAMIFKTSQMKKTKEWTEEKEEKRRRGRYVSGLREAWHSREQKKTCSQEGQHLTLCLWDSLKWVWQVLQTFFLLLCMMAATKLGQSLEKITCLNY